MLQQLSTVTLHFPAFLPKYLLLCNIMLRWCHEQLVRESLLPPWPQLYDHFTFINFEHVGVSPISLVYSFSCGVPIKPIIQICYIQIDCI
jgi:hypothetical protein